MKIAATPSSMRSLDAAFNKNIIRRVMLSAVEPLAQANITPRYAIERASWVWHPDLREDDVAVLRFARVFTVDTTTSFRMHVSADQRYELSLNGESVSAGPHRSDLAHWSFASFDVILPPGEHVLEALVWWIGDWMPRAQVTSRGGFICAAEGCESQVNTGKAEWMVQRLSGWSFAKPDVGALHVIGPAQTIDGFQWFGPQETARPANVVMGAMASSPVGVARDGWQLHPSPLPEMLRRACRPGRVRSVTSQCPRSHPFPVDNLAPDITRAWQAMVTRGQAMEVAANQEVHVLWDLEDYYCGYASCAFSGGEGAEVRFEWAESLFEVDSDGTRSQAKGQRDEITGKLWLGFGDTFLADGGENRAFRGHWWRSGRYVLVSVRTARAPLRIEKIELVETRYPFEDESTWQSDDEELDAFLPIARRGLWMCAHETFVDCPYYEQLMYVGDTRLDMLMAYTQSSDDRLTRRGIELFDWSRSRTGFVAERYPSTPYMLSLTFAMLWVAMLRDYAYWRDDPAWVASRIPGVRSLLEQFFALPHDGGLLTSLPGWSFVDWVDEWDTGIPPAGRDGVSSVINLLYVQCLQHAADLEDGFGETVLGQRYRTRAEQVGRDIVDRFWHKPSGRLSDDTAQRHFSEHAQALALLTGILNDSQIRRVRSALRQASERMSQATIYFSFYVLEALYQQGEAHLFHDRLTYWKSLRQQGFKTPMELPEPTRSDCHAWGSHPLFHCHASIAGIRPAAPGFRSVHIAPAPGPLRHIESTIPHPRGAVRVSLSFDPDTARCVGEIHLPEQTEGAFIWADQTIALRPGGQAICVEKGAPVEVIS